MPLTIPRLMAMIFLKFYASLIKACPLTTEKYEIVLKVRHT